MDNNLWEHLAPLFEKAIDMPPEERTVFLDGIKAKDYKTWSELTSLLDNSEQATPFLADIRKAVRPSPKSAKKIHFVDPYKLIGTKVSRYDIVDVLGRGSMGVVYKAHNAELHRNVALKLLPPAQSDDTLARERFMREAKAASELDHLNVCTIHEIGSSPMGQAYIAMAYYEGETLAKILSRGPLPNDQVIDYSRQIASGLQAAHAKDIVHLDIKPRNIIITHKGVAIILDFGIAKMNHQQLAQTGLTLDSSSYLSPERVRDDKSGPECDIWSLGVLMYQMVTGQPPFKGTSHETIVYKILHEEPAYERDMPSHTPEFVQSIIRCCLEKNVDQRYSNMGDVLALF